jgi:hypothetical protein
MRFDVITTLSVIPCSIVGTYQRNFYPEDEGRMFLRNVRCLVICGLSDDSSLGSIASNCTNKTKAPLYEDVWGSGSIAPPFSTSVLDVGEW